MCYGTCDALILLCEHRVLCYTDYSQITVVLKEKDGSMAETANDNIQIKEVITPEVPKQDDGFELLDLDGNGIPDLLEDDEEVDAASDAQRVAASLSRRSVTMTVDSTDGSMANSSPYRVADALRNAGYEDEEDEYDYDYEEDYEEEDDYEDSYEG